MKDKEKAKQIAEVSQILSDFPHDYHSVEYGALKMAQWKDEQARLKKEQLIEKAWQWIFRLFVITALLDFQQAIEEDFRKEMKGE